MFRDFDDLAAKLPVDVRERARKQADEMRAEILLAEIRKQQSLTQAEIAAALGVKQLPASTLETADEMQLSTLRRLVAAMGLHLDVAVVLADGRRINLTQIEN